MSRHPTTPFGATGRADLLRALNLQKREHLTLEHNAQGWFGYVLRDETEPPPPVGEPASVKLTMSVQPTVEVVTPHRPPLKMPSTLIIVRRESRPPVERENNPPVSARPLAPTDPDIFNPPLKRLIDYEDIVPPARLLPALWRYLGATRPGPLDLERLIDHYAAGTLPRRLPVRRLLRWHPQLVVVLDFSARLWPYREDMHRLAERLLQRCGRSGVSLRVINHGPLGLWSDWCAHQDEQRYDIPPDYPWRMPPAGTPVLLVSDLGLLPGAESVPSRAWSRFIDQLRCAQVRPIALVPLGAEQLHAPLTNRLPVLRWSPDAPAHPVRAHAEATTLPAGLDDLLAMIAATRRTDPPLLRDMRQINPQAPLNAGLEGAAWCHADVEAGTVVTIRADKRDSHLDRFSKIKPHLQIRQDELRSRHHAHLRPVVNHEEMLLWSAHADEIALAAVGVQDRINQATGFMDRLSSLLAQADSPQTLGVWQDVAKGIVQRADKRMAEAYGSTLYPLLANAIRLQGGLGHGPAWADPAEIPVLGDLPQTHGWLVQDAASGCLLLQAESAGPRQSALGAALRLDGGLSVSTPGASDALLSLNQKLPIRLARLNTITELELLTAHESLTLAPVQRPRGASGWSVSGNGITVAVAAVAGTGYEIPESALACIRPSVNQPSGGWHLQSDAVEIKIGEQRITYGIDAPYGIYVDLHIQTRHGQATQRLRWIEPGTFLMGSLDSEPGHYNNEGPQHPVTLTRGFWLADTACTQALWQAVTGRNPSHFKGNLQCPVETVSWNDVQKFLRALEGLLPGIEACLPNEAQWEYACRAGTETAYHFGNDITPERANYGNSIKKTVPVKSLPANDWGLYEMHGNVLEWCADGPRTYDEAPQQDPEGPAGSTRRAVRGGSWFYHAWGARSAYRGARDPGFAVGILGDLGFRLCLRSSGQVRPGGPSGASRAQRATDFFSRPGKSGDKRKK